MNELLRMERIEAKVLKPNKKQRVGKGFSSSELKKAGSSLSEGLKLHIPIDPKRKTVHEDNVEALKLFLKQRKTRVKQEKVERKPKKA